MKPNRIKETLKAKLNEWLRTPELDDSALREEVRRNVVCAGGAIVSMLRDEKPNDFDFYFRSKDTALKVARRYVEKWNLANKGITLRECDGQVRFDVPGRMYVAAKDRTTSEVGMKEGTCISANAITLPSNIQIIFRFCGEAAVLCPSFDFLHCQVGWDASDDGLYLPNEALLCLLDQRLVYTGSQYPLCSLFRTKKFIQRGWKIDAGQYLKMAFDINELDLGDVAVLKEQLIGVDAMFFGELLSLIESDMQKGTAIDNLYIMKLIDLVF